MNSKTQRGRTLDPIWTLGGETKEDNLLYLVRRTGYSVRTLARYRDMTGPPPPLFRRTMSKVLRKPALLLFNITLAQGGE